MLLADREVKAMKKLIVALVLMLSGQAGAAHPFGWDDMFAMVRLSDPQPSPDAKWVLFSRSEYSLEKNKGNTDLGLVPIEGGPERRLTSGPSVEVNGRWLPDSKTIVFLSNRSDSMQIWKLPLEGGEATQVSKLEVDIEGFELSPDGEKVLLWVKVFPDCKSLACTAKRLGEKKKSPIKAMLFDKIPIRHWDTWKDGRRNHLFVMSLKDQKPRDLMKGMDQDCPTIPWGGGDEVAWSPDSKEIAFASKPSAGEAWHTNTEIYLVRADGKRKPRLVTRDNPAWDTGPAYSPDGKTLGYLAMDRPGYESDKFHIVLMDRKSGKKRHLAKEWDRSVRTLVWSADSSTIYATASEHARVKLFSVEVESGKAKALVEEGSNKYPQITRLGTLVFLRDRLTHPREVFVHNPGTSKTAQLSRINQERLNETRMSDPEEFWFEHDGRKLHGWLLKPVGFKPGKKYPLAFLIHGGPQGYWGDGFHYRWNAQFYAGAGYAAVAVDFRGSSSYGQDFTDAIRGDWGAGPYSDLMAGLEHVLKEHKFIDKRRMCALGASYGGYMINWIAGQEHPFKCLINHDGDFDITSHYFDTEELWFPEWDMTGTPWEKREVYERNSPMNHVGKWKTPMLVIQGALDFRVAETHAFSAFNALQRLEIESQLLYFPDENHWVLKPQNSRLWHQTVLKWLDRWTRTKRRKY
jgi:dipeptidyl aminopeptidase/acylaminoacyl peptidase